MISNRTKAFTLVEIMIVVAIIAILVGLAVPGFIRARSQSRVKSCQENLTKIDGAVEQFALDHSKHAGDPVVYPDDLLTPDGSALGSGYLKSEPFCPSNGTSPYQIAKIGGVPVCPAPQPGHSMSEIGTVTTQVEQ